MKLQTLFITLFASASSVLANCKPCATITEDGDVFCSTCIRPGCLALSTVTPANCPGGVNPTVTVDYPCGSSCPTGCASTSYIYVTPSGTTTIVTPTAKQCAVTVTNTVNGGIKGGCKFDCSSDFCIRDEILTLPCGCDEATTVVTRTHTTCPTRSPCYNCYTGYTFTTTATSCH